MSVVESKSDPPPEPQPATYGSSSECSAAADYPWRSTSHPVVTSMDQLSPATRTAWDILRSPHPSIPSLITAISDPSCEVNRVVKGSVIGTKHERTLLTYALTNPKLSVACATALIECERVGCEVQHSRGVSPSIYAASYNQVECLKLLSHSRGVDVAKLCSAGYSPLYGALSCKVTAATRWLLSQEEDGGHVDPHQPVHRDGRSAVLVASQFAELDATALLVVVYGVASPMSQASKSQISSPLLKGFHGLWEDPEVQSFLSTWAAAIRSSEGSRSSSSSSDPASSQPTTTTDSDVFAAHLPASAHSELYSPESSFDTRCTILQWVKLYVSSAVVRGVLDSGEVADTESVAALEGDVACVRDASTPLSRRLVVLSRAASMVIEGGLLLPTAMSLEDLLPATRAAWEEVLSGTPSIDALSTAVSDPMCEVNRRLSEHVTGSARDYTLLTYAQSRKKFDAVDVLLRCDRVRGDVEDSRGASAATWAAWADHIPSLELLKEVKGVDLSRNCSVGRSPLLEALQYDQPDTARWLLLKGSADPHIPDHKTGPLHLAIEKGAIDIAAMLVVAFKADLHAEDQTGVTPLSLATSPVLKSFFSLWEDAELQSFLTTWTNSISVIATPSDGSTVGSFALLPTSAHTQLFSPESSFDARCIVLQWVKLYVSSAVVRGVFEQGNVVSSSSDFWGASFLANAWSFGSLAGSFSSWFTSDSHVAVAVAATDTAEGFTASTDDLACVRDMSVSLSRRLAVLGGVASMVVDGGLLLPTAMSMDDLLPATRAAWEEVLSRTPNLDALSTAVRDPMCEVNRLVHNDALGSPHGHTLLTYALNSHKFNAVGVLLRCDRVRGDVQDSKGAPAVAYAARLGHVPSLKLLKELKGVDLSRGCSSIASPLSQTIVGRHLDTARWLLMECGVNLHLSDSLLYASKEGHSSVAAMLVVVYKADLHATSNAGGTSLSLQTRSELKAFYSLWDDPVIQSLLARWNCSRSISCPAPAEVAHLHASAHAELYSPESLLETRYSVLLWLRLSTTALGSAVLTSESMEEALSLFVTQEALPAASSERMCLLGALLVACGKVQSTDAPLSTRASMLSCLVDGGSLSLTAKSNEELLPVTRSAWKEVRCAEPSSSALTAAANDPLCEVNRSIRFGGPDRAPFSHTLLTRCLHDGKEDAALTLLQCSRVDCGGGVVTGDGEGCLFLAAQRADWIGVVLALLSRGAVVKVGKRSALTRAVELGHHDVVEALVCDRGFVRVLEWKDVSGRTARETAVRRGGHDDEMVTMLDEAMEVGRLWERRVTGVAIGLAAADGRTRCGSRRLVAKEKRRKLLGSSSLLG